MSFVDYYGRRLNYLPIPVIDRCNLRCLYGMPSKGVRRQRHREILTYEEIVAYVQAAAGLGIIRRLTGDEPNGRCQRLSHHISAGQVTIQD